MYDVMIFSRSRIRKLFMYSRSFNPQECVRISITDPNNEHALIMHPKLKDVLYVNFDDVRNKNHKHAMSTEQGIQIVDFVKHYKMLPFVVNCEAGISRSSAVAKFICYVKGVSDSWISYPKYDPNDHVFNTLMLLYQRNDIK